MQCKVYLEGDNMKYLFSLILLGSLNCQANVASQIETSLNKSNLIENLLAGLDIKIDDVALDQLKAKPSKSASYFASLRLKITDEQGNDEFVEIFRTDEFSSKSTASMVNKEYFLNGDSVFNSLEKHLNKIEASKDINIDFSLVKHSASPRAISQNTIAEPKNEILNQGSVKYDLYFR